MTRFYPQYARSLVGAVILIFLTGVFLYQGGENSPVNFLSHHKGPDCNVDLEFLRSFGYNETVDYARWNIQVVPSPKFSQFSDSLDFGEPVFNELDLGGNEEWDRLNASQCSSTMTVEAPMPKKPVDASHIMFGVATTMERLNDTLPVFSRWASGTNARIISIVERDHTRSLSELVKHAEDLAINLHIIESDEPFLDRYYMLTRTMLELHDGHTEWAVIIDDDTFFPSMDGLVTDLATYDSSKPYYIGAPTENLQQMATFTFMAYGGAGVFLSIPLLKEIDQHYDDCYDNKDTGDKRVAWCVYTYTNTKLTWDRRLFQLDLTNDGSGFYEAGRELPLSLHHWKSSDWYPVDILNMSKVSDVCGPDCQLRRWKVTDQWYFINGFSLVKYSSAPSLEELASMEQTWEYYRWTEDDNYGFSLGPLRPRDNKKVSYRLKGAISERHRVRQVYMREPDRTNRLERPQVLEVVWTRT
ncbi:uncharacterized protein N7483_007307 [Penicillium malachiteum]|uniref:uncharacterized protein n=1 Tax=Penicillium malachiteum TaxID=1324776 RepID=UPI00254850A7|nr:uncharacterized protein N7483_007307 [Penicillium malachiteum]KAJ5725950.1 hypothetical protein N7483_007307 [Penicillium malachiteum]